MTVKNFGEICNNTAECSDHRYVCEEDEFQIFRCFCDRFHLWMGKENGCVQVVNVSDIINITRRQHKYQEFIENEAETFFIVHTIAGLFIILIVAITFIFIIIYLYRVHQTDNRMKKQLIRRGIDLKCDHFSTMMGKNQRKPRMGLTEI